MEKVLVAMLQGDDLAAFMTNVSVGEDSRGQGIGKALLEQSIEKAKTSWSAARIFAFVDSDNEVCTPVASPSARPCRAPPPLPFQ